ARSTTSAWRSSAISSTAWTCRSCPTSPRRKTIPAGAPAEAERLPSNFDLEVGLRILIALVLGLALGTERETQGHPAGMRTMALISAGACMFTVAGLEPAFGTRTDPTRIAAQIVTGVGFIGAGAILRQGNDIRGLTTAASIWVAAALG